MPGSALFFYHATMSLRITSAVSVNCTIQWTGCSEQKNRSASPALHMETPWQQDTVSPLLLRHVWFPNKCARSIYIFVPNALDTRNQKGKVRDVAVLCERVLTQTPDMKLGQRKVFDHFFVWRVQFTIFVRCLGPRLFLVRTGPLL